MADESPFLSTDPPILDPAFMDVRSRNFQMVTLRCAVVRANPTRLTDIRWFRNGGLIRTPLPMPTTELKEPPELKFKLEPTNNGTYECRVSSNVGTSTCMFNVSGRSARRPLPVCRRKSSPEPFPELFIISHSATLQRRVLLRHAQPSPHPKREQLFLLPAVDAKKSRGHRPRHWLLAERSKGKSSKSSRMSTLVKRADSVPQRLAGRAGGRSQQTGIDHSSWVETGI